MSNFATSAFAPGVNIPKNVNMSNNAKKNIATVSLLGVAGAGAAAISKNTFGRSFAWNTATNKFLNKVAQNVANFAEKNSILGMFSKTKAGKVVGKVVQTVANKGAGLVQEVAGKLAKTSGRQKLLGALAMGTIATVMGVREHFSKKEGADDQKAVDSKKVKTLKTAYENKYES